MISSNWQKIEELFEIAVELTTDERDAYLAKACDGDDDLRREVENLLNADEKAEDFIESPILGEHSLAGFLPQTIEISVPPDSIGRRIGAYEIIRELGKGGMGAVFLARRADAEFNKLVAIKLIKRGLDSDFILRRFRNERQILATLDHPNIARLLDGGTTDDGLPYFVMEYIDGLPIHHFCDENRLTVSERLRLFQKVCEAVQYAHHNQVIHRDLKPGNILVTKDRRIKLLDFGIAKILDPELAADTLQPTLTGILLMTPDYASPEQVRGETLTTASDIYALGVLLYEIISGKRPYQFPSRAPHDIARVICEEEPKSLISVIKEETPKPDFPQKKNNNGILTIEELCRRRQTTLENLRRELSGAVQIILLKALQKLPENRYQTAESFAEDIQLLLDGKTVSAADSPWQKDVSFDSSSDAVSSKSLAVLPFRQIRFKSAAEELPDTGDFLSLGLTDSLITRLSNLRNVVVRPTSSVLRYAQNTSIDPSSAGRELNVSHILEGRIQNVKNRVRVTVQLIQVSNNETVWAGQFEDDNEDILNLQDSISAQVAESLVSQLSGEEREKLEKRGTNNAKAYEAYSRGRWFWHRKSIEDTAKALVCYYEAIELDPNFVLAYCGIADYYNFLGIYGIMPPAECFPAAREAAERAVALDPGSAEAYTSLAIVAFGYDWNFAQSEKLFRRAIELNPNFAGAYVWFSQLQSIRGKHEDALRLVRRAEKLNPQSVAILISAALNLRNAGKFPESLAKLRQALAIRPHYYVALQGFSWIAEPLNLHNEAEKACLEAVENTERLGLAMSSYGYVLGLSGKLDEARKILRELELRSRKLYVPTVYIALIYLGLKEYDKVFQLLEKAVSTRDFWAVWVASDPRFEPVKSDARFAEFVKKISPSSAGEEIHLSQLDTQLLPFSDKSTQEIEAGNEAETKEMLRRNFWLKPRLALAFVSLLLLGLLVFAGFKSGVLTVEISRNSKVADGKQIAETNSANQAERATVLILPFKTASNLESDTTLGIGLAEAVYRRLGQINRLEVSPAMYKAETNNLSLNELRKQFNVNYVLRGKLVNIGDKVEVSAELVRIRDEEILWTERFSENINNFEALPVAVSERVLNALTIELSANERRQIGKRYTENSEAYQLYLVGRYQMANRSAENLEKAIRTFEKSSLLDPKFALAYAGLADAYALLNLYQIPPPADAYKKAKENAEKALSLDEQLAEAHASRGYVLFFYERNRSEAEQEFRRAIELNLSYSTAYHSLALTSSAAGKKDDAIANIKTAMKLEPRSAIIHTAAGLVFFYARNYEEAQKVCRQALEIDAGFVPAHKTMRVINEAAGNYEEANAAFQKERVFSGNTDPNEPSWLMISAQVQAVGNQREEALKSLQVAAQDPNVKNNLSAFAYEIALGYALSGENDAAFEWLKKADKANTYGFNFVQVDPRFDKIRNDARFAELNDKFKNQ